MPDGMTDLQFALTCRHCNRTGDSFGRYVSTYCHKRNEHIHGFKPKKPIPCGDCPNYAPLGTAPRPEVKYEQPLIDRDHRHSLWYGGDVLSMKYKDAVIVLRANGDIIMQYFPEQGESVAIMEKDCRGVFYERFSPFIPDDKALDGLIAAARDLDDDYGAVPRLEVTDTNWWEAFTYKNGIQTGSAVLASDYYDEALAELLDRIDEIYDATEC